jgi:glutamine amidotransferase
MCRFLAYSGVPVFLEDFVASPCHSLIHQSLHAEEAKTGTNGDGFGVGWYGERPEPGQYREVRPPGRTRTCSRSRGRCASHLFSPMSGPQPAPRRRGELPSFVHGRYLFMHNGQIGGYGTIRRRLEALIPDSLYGARAGTTDLEALFLLTAHLADGMVPDDAWRLRSPTRFP